MTQLSEKAERGGTVLIVAPVGADAHLAAGVLADAGIDAKICGALADAVAEMGENTSALLLAEEALDANQLKLLLDALQRQPAWSDLPVVILTGSEGSNRLTPDVAELFGPAGNVTRLERPLHEVKLLGAMRTALRARRRQYEVRELIEQHDAVLAGISDAFSSIDHQWRYTHVNDRVAQLAGKAKEEMVGRNIWEIFPGSVGTEFYHLAHEAMNERRSVQGEFFHKPWNCWLETRIYPSKGGIIIFRADITEQKRQEIVARERDLKLQESEDLLRLATEAADIGTFDYYPQTGELRLSDRARMLFGIEPEGRVNYETYVAAVHPADRHILGGIADRVANPLTGDRYDIEYRLVAAADGREHWIAEKGRGLVDASGKAVRFIGTFLDITKEKNAETLLQRAKQEAEQANRAKDQFLAMLSHELRTPLTPVLMTLASLRREPNLSEELHRDLEVLQRNVELEALLIDDLLDLTRIAHGKLELHNDAVDIHATLEHALAISLSERDEKNLIVTRDFTAAEHHSWADAARLQQVFWNLVKNAVKFTPPGGRIELRTKNDKAHRVVVEISDTGIGIDASLLPRIFDAFEQGGRAVTNQYGGLGLGLAISKRVVDMHNGSITARSAGRGQGASFTVTLPAMETSLLNGPIFCIPSEPLVMETAMILLVEDHEDTARVLRRILEHGGYVVAHADSLAAARELAAGTRFDLVISDLGLPDGSGVDLMRFLRAHHNLSGIALSGFGTDEDIRASVEAGFAEHLTKPVDWPRLRDAIDRLLAQKANDRGTEAAAS